MYEDSSLERELAAAVSLVLSDDAEAFVLGDFVGVVEAVSEAGSGVVVIARDLQPRHLRLLLRAADQIVANHVEESGSGSSAKEPDNG